MWKGELWHFVEARRDDGSPTMFRIRELDPLTELTTIFVVEVPYPTTEMSRLPNATAYRRLSQFEEQWLKPACAKLGWELVASKTEDGSCFMYLYGASDPTALIARLSPFDASLGFYDDEDPQWSEYATLRALLEQAKAMPPEFLEPNVPPSIDLTMPTGMVAAPPKATRRVKPKGKAKAKSKPRAKPAPRTKPRSKSKPKKQRRTKR